MKIIKPQTIAFTAKVTEDELRERMAFEVLEQIGGLDADGKPLPGIRWRVTRGTGRAGGPMTDQVAVTPMGSPLTGSIRPRDIPAATSGW